MIFRVLFIRSYHRKFAQIENSWGLCVCAWIYFESMPQGELGSFSVSLRRNLSRRRSFRSGVDRDDRGWTLLHIGARKGDLKEVIFFFQLHFLAAIFNDRVNTNYFLISNVNFILVSLFLGLITEHESFILGTIYPCCNCDYWTANPRHKLLRKLFFFPVFFLYPLEMQGNSVRLCKYKISHFYKKSYCAFGNSRGFSILAFNYES